MIARHVCAGLVLAALPCAALRAQAIEAGRVVDDSTHAPLHNVCVSLQSPTAEGWVKVDSARTDRNGLFQIRLPHPGVYRVGFVGRFAPLFYGTPDTLAVDSMQQRNFALPIARTRGSRAYFEFEVDTSARPEEHGDIPNYPVEMRSQGIEGQIAAQFVVTPEGKPDMTTFEVLGTTDRAFAESVRRFLGRARFKPGVVGGVAVREMVQEMFYFSINRRN